MRCALSIRLLAQPVGSRSLRFVLALVWAMHPAMAAADCLDEALAVVGAESATEHSRFLARGESATFRVDMTGRCLSALAIGPVDSGVALVIHVANGEELARVDHQRNSALLTACTTAAEVFLSVHMRLGAGRVDVAYSHRTTASNGQEGFNGWGTRAWRDREGLCFSPPLVAPTAPYDVGDEPHFSVAQIETAVRDERLQAGWLAAGNQLDGLQIFERGCYALVTNESSAALLVSIPEREIFRGTGELEFCLPERTAVRVSSTIRSGPAHLLFRREYLEPPIGINAAEWMSARTEGPLEPVVHLRAGARQQWRETRTFQPGCHRLVVFTDVRLSLSVGRPNAPIHQTTTDRSSQILFCLDGPTAVTLRLDVHGVMGDLFLYEGPR